MLRIPYPSLSALVLATAAGAVSPAHAQTQTAQVGNEVVAPARPEADELAREMRILADSPRDIRALLAAAALSAKLNDTAAALAFLARAEAIDPANARVLALRGSVLVRIERPGEALRLFQQAESWGQKMAEFTGDRGLAYDLLGASALAQHDYEASLDFKQDDETVRRYALSLGIVGRPDEAMRMLDPLLRRKDRAAWRARAFILAMNGDIAGAEKIAASMMPGNMGLALTPFFRRLGGLSAADRAFAVHFGQLTPTEARLADAELSPLQRAPGAPRPAAARLAQGGPIVAVQPLPSPPSFVETRVATLDPLPKTIPVRQSPMRGLDTPAPAPKPAAVSMPSPTPTAVTPKPAVAAPREDLLASIVSTIKIPESELALLDDAGDGEFEAAAPPARLASATPARPRVETPKPAAKPPAKPAADAKAKKKPEPPKAKPEPSRVWVQVAGGANENSLPATWRKLAKQAPAPFKGKSAWTTPLRATNRLLAGPFKSGGEAQGFVNQLKKADIDAFVFTSETGQKITKLEVK